MNHETDSLEVIKYNEKLDIKEDKTDFIFYFSDNDGPYLIFDSNIFQYKSTVLEIKKYYAIINGLNNIRKNVLL